MISKCCILTAAHCVKGRFANSVFNTKRVTSLKICLGRACGNCSQGYYDPKNRSNAKEAQCYKAHRIKIHPGYIYNATHLENDIAIVQLRPDNCIKCVASSASPVCLPVATRDAPYLQPGRNTWVSGWGEIRLGEGLSYCLRKGRTEIVEQDRCRAHYAQNSFIVSKDKMCALSENGACYGDSGSPMIYRNQQYDNRFVLAGLVSWGMGCGRSGSYGVYSNVSYFLDWIYQKCTDYK